MKITNYILAALAVSLLISCASTTRYLNGKSEWYRELHREGWAEDGGDSEVINQVIKNIKNKNNGTSNYYDRHTSQYTVGNWNYEWDQVATKAENNNNYLQATIYSSIAAYPFVNMDKHAQLSYKKALINYKKAVEKGGFNLEYIPLSSEKGDMQVALHLPENKDKDPRPVIIMTNGSDKVLTYLYPFYRDYFSLQGWAMISFDLPGIGANSLIQQDPSNTNSIHQRVLQFIKDDPRLDENSIALVGKSFGGHSAAKMAFTDQDDLSAVVSWCGVINRPFKNLRFSAHKAPPMTKDAFISRFSLSEEALYQRGHELALSEKFLGKVQTSVPILAINHGNDKLSPLGDMKLLKMSSKAGEVIVIDEDNTEGHCSSDMPSLQQIIPWLTQYL
ncbi:alpha/beta hydrolase [Pseudoalteromonas denitrificans]|uniref:Alpha/beta hydrolase family protein n=1 Tax=Pseudoalteromonas denitrificans DSM 6059 TaxID=1123010 RepID=A0A1I1SYN9_9GAMM|nr:alpha/beta hydrolase [Pseudoalteromonas denitrificans]SFD51536.1 Alpha/beta hydrolase of unknown function [Pseudoalteromonas denitrificans DSM 6059]